MIKLLIAGFATVLLVLSSTVFASKKCCLDENGKRTGVVCSKNAFGTGHNCAAKKGCGKCIPFKMGNPNE